MNKALLIGITKYPTAPLSGCINDISAMADFLVDNNIFKEKEIRLLADSRAKTHAIKDRLEWLVKDAKKGDKLFFYYSGHGAQMPTRDINGEVDGLDEVICPVDFDWTDEKAVRDKDFDRIFGKVPKGVEFIWISDSCHSGDLTSAEPHYFYQHVNESDEQIKFGSEKEPIGTPKFIPQPIDIHWRTRTACKENITKKKKKNFNLAFISGCRPEQISRDARFGKTYHGALTYCLLKVLNKNGLNKPLDELVEETRKMLKRHKFKQIPHLEGTDVIIHKPFFVSK
jgi:metacaspase-1